jgi:hypothetical protein
MQPLLGLRRFMNLYRLSLFAAFGSVVCIASAQNGTLYFSQDGTGRLFDMNTSSGAGTDIGSTGVTSATNGLTERGSGSDLWGSLPFGLTDIDPVTGTHVAIGGNMVAEGLAMNPTTGVLYWSLNNQFGTADTSNGNNLLTLTAPGSDVEGLAYAMGFIYGSDDQGNLKRYDIGADSWSTIGNIGFASDNSGLAYDPIGDFF